MSKPTEKIWAVTAAPGAQPVHVSKRIKKTAAWRIQGMREVGDPAAEPAPLKSAKPTKAELVKIERLEQEKADLQARLEALEAASKGKTETTQTQTA